MMTAIANPLELERAALHRLTNATRTASNHLPNSHRLIAAMVLQDLETLFGGMLDRLELQAKQIEVAQAMGRRSVKEEELVAMRERHLQLAFRLQALERIHPGGL